MHKIHISQSTRKDMHKINSAKFLESININNKNRSIINQYKRWPACFPADLDRSISRISLNSAVFFFGAEI